MNKDITDIAKDIKKIAELDLIGEWDIIHRLICEYLKFEGHILNHDQETDTDFTMGLNAKKLPLSTVVEWLNENVIEFMEGENIVEFNYEQFNRCEWK